MLRLKPFLPCFYDVPFKQVQKILGVSHHTLDPIRRSLNLDRWPYAQIARGAFCSREEVVELRGKMMSAADNEMQKILCKISTASELIWRSTREKAPVPPKTPPPSVADPQDLHTAQEQEDQLLLDSFTDREDSTAFWEEISQLFSFKEAVSEGRDDAPPLFH
jgi:hypothetical protein